MCGNRVGKYLLVFSASLLLGVCIAGLLGPDKKRLVRRPEEPSGKKNAASPSIRCRPYGPIFKLEREIMGLEWELKAGLLPLAERKEAKRELKGLKERLLFLKQKKDAKDVLKSIPHPQRLFELEHCEEY